MNNKSEYANKAQKYMQEYIDKGYQCGQASVLALAGAYEIPLCQEIVNQSLLFTKGAGVGDRCAVFQAALVILGLWYGRIEPYEDRKRMRKAASELAGRFRECKGSYMCRDLATGYGTGDLCDKQKLKEMIKIASDILYELRKYMQEKDGEEI